MGETIVQGGGSEAANLRASVQWIILSAGALAAALIARIPHTDVESLSTLGLVVATACLSVAALFAGVVLFKAARVLTVAHMPASEIAARQQGHLSRLDRELEPPRDLVTRVVQGRASELLASFGSVDAALASKRRVHARLMSPGLRSGGGLDRQLLLAQLSDVDNRLAEVRAAVQYEASLARHHDLLKTIPWAGLVMISCVFVYVLTPLVFPREGVSQISEPVPVTVSIANPSVFNISNTCPYRRPGVAIAGTKSTPVVVLEPVSQSCPGETLILKRDAPAVVSYQDG